jgi:hypothetical protein
MYLFQCSPFRSLIASLSIAIFCVFRLAVPALAQVADECWQGKADGERDAKGNPLWILAGLGCGIFGAGAAYLAKPSPPTYALMGKSSQYVLCYTEAYQSKSRWKNTGYAFLGWATWIVIFLASGGLEDIEENGS